MGLPNPTAARRAVRPAAATPRTVQLALVDDSGVEQLAGATHRVIPDRIEVATLLIAAAITQGTATVVGARPDHLTAVLEVLAATGADTVLGPDHSATRAFAKASITMDRVDLWQARLALKTLRLDQRQATAETSEG